MERHEFTWNIDWESGDYVDFATNPHGSTRTTGTYMKRKTEHARTHTRTRTRTHAHARSGLVLFAGLMGARSSALGKLSYSFFCQV